jgi:hypothetical protein
LLAAASKLGKSVLILQIRSNMQILNRRGVTKTPAEIDNWLEAALLDKQWPVRVR